ncbi:hypothetical protein H2509_01015 [Stappia sp. F7233]|uniref:Uncharacterized protein n=1 Tax=Stappia albiluteola TaxID=2758565 RepID=A0A839A810_9HYPH|nr:hypothetical protein [Stappia albiluteola]MBA5775700.1 hypothetical protein [Stappia albiluteola]
MTTPAHDAALLERLSRVLHEMGLPCACQEEVERTVAVFAEFESRRTRRRLIEGARERRRRLRQYLEFLGDLEDDSLGPDEVAEMADSFRVISATAAEGAAILEMLAAMAGGNR